MRFISVGDLVTDYYYQDNTLLGVCGGNTSHNVIANLSYNGVKTAVYGVCGNDSQGLIAIKSLEDLGVDVSNIKKIDNLKTRSLHVSYFNTDKKVDFISKRRCPHCLNKSWYIDSMIDEDEILSCILPDDILVFDNLNSKNQKIIDNLGNTKVIDLGYFHEFENLSEEELIDKIRDKFEIINFNERVSKYLLERFQLSSVLELYSLLRPKLMTITKGEEGVIFIFKNKIYQFPLIISGEVIDPTGAGDAFLSSILSSWINNNFEYNPNLFKSWYEQSNKLTSIVVSKMGARGHIEPLYKVDKTLNCTCQEFTIPNMVLKKTKDI